jgi:hypothetical protein
MKMPNSKNVIRCPQGHYYNGDKYTSCPLCARGEAPNPDPVDIPMEPISKSTDTPKKEPKTVPMWKWGKKPKDRTETEDPKKQSETPKDEDDPSPDSEFGDVPKEDTDTRALQEVIRKADINEDELYTISIDGGSKTNVTGWLVAISGPNIGKDYRIGDGKNHIGRGPDSKLEIVIIGDQSISRTHTVILYDATSNTFYLQPNEGDGMVHVNGDLVLSPQKLKKGDRIKLGNTELYFVPFCGEDFSWDQVL